MAARAAGQLDLAVTLYQRLSDTAPQPSDGVDAALALVELHLERGSWEEAWQGLAPVARRAEAIDNVAGWALLVLRVGDGALAADDAAAALSAYQFLPSRAELLRRHDDRDRQMEVKLAGLRSLAGNGAADLESGRRLEQRRLQGAQARAELAKHEGFDAALLLRRARAFHARGQIWEAALVLERLIERHTRAAECELGFALWVRALAEAGRSGRLDTVVDRFLAAYPRSAHAAQALTLAAHAAGERGDRDRQLRWLDQALILNPPPELRETLLLLRANALMAAGRHDEARTAAARVLEEFGEGRFAEEATYLRTMAGLLAGQPRRALEELAAYRGRFPAGRFAADAQYREAAAHYALNEPDPALAILADWLERHPPEHAQRGEVFSLQGDVWVALRREDEAVAAYEQALKHPLSTEGRGYVLDELTRLHVAHREFEAASRRWEETVAGDPDPVFLVQAAYWIGRLRLQAGDHRRRGQPHGRPGAPAPRPPEAGGRGARACSKWRARPAVPAAQVRGRNRSSHGC
jgi:tetratricopeptide (TPR) repeat protein